MHTFTDHIRNIRACRLCAERFAVTKTAHRPRPVVWLSQTARIMVVGQAPGARVHASGRPFTDASGDRLRQWMGVDSATFYDQDKVAIFPMAFCFPGYDAKGSDLPPPKICADHWRADTLALMPQVRLTLLVGGYAQKWHLGAKSMSETVANWQKYDPYIIPLPHPSWRNTSWLKKNPWFETDLIPHLRHRVTELL
ncbi:uracil-DNA glycosylase family protein [Neptunicoccus cionae]|uniref:uracil-DNA glycosylase family protein n=1 Tax=Neptunicoccus cionae TaxID=2035344 RepID=UPI000C78B874|nr:uracil-DNA glycosylase family protein [Amylibacter cionae]PLS22543.1 uracil-DNA glycosylase [Amylibacter cionae]